jgi:D-alanyl-D-alanine carboxypeptidase
VSARYVNCVTQSAQFTASASRSTSRPHILTIGYGRSSAPAAISLIKTWEIVRIFEAHGFIRRGKWYHYDTMHFEYRPELIGAAK